MGLRNHNNRPPARAKECEVNMASTMEVVFLKDSKNPSFIPQFEKELRNGDSEVMPLHEAINLCKTSANFALDLDSLREGGR